MTYFSVGSITLFSVPGYNNAQGRDALETDIRIHGIPRESAKVTLLRALPFGDITLLP